MSTNKPVVFPAPYDPNYEEQRERFPPLERRPRQPYLVPPAAEPNERTVAAPVHPAPKPQHGTGNGLTADR